VRRRRPSPWQARLRITAAALALIAATFALVLLRAG